MIRSAAHAERNERVHVRHRGFAQADTGAEAVGAQGADFFTVVAWKGTAEACGKYLSKGKKAAVCGRLQTRSYEAKRSPEAERFEERCDRSSQQINKRFVTEIVAEEVEFLFPREESAFAPYSQAELEPVGSDEPLPF